MLTHVVLLEQGRLLRDLQACSSSILEFEMEDTISGIYDNEGTLAIKQNASGPSKLVGNKAIAPVLGSDG